MRLEKSIHISVGQLVDILRFVYEHEDDKGIKWSPEILYTYVPRTFETAVVPECVAASALYSAIGNNVFNLFPR